MKNLHTPFEELTITNKFMFALVFSHKEIAKAFLEAILGIEIFDIKEPEPEKSIEIGPASKEVRLDVFCKGTRPQWLSLSSIQYKNARRNRRSRRFGTRTSGQRKKSC